MNKKPYVIAYTFSLNKCFEVQIRFTLGKLLGKDSIDAIMYKRILNDIREVYNNVCMFEFEVGTDIKFR